MTTKLKFTLNIKPKKSLNVANDFLDVVRLHCRMLPEYMPSKHDWTEPFKKFFNPVDLSNLVASNGKADNTWWKRTEKPKANGGWMRSGIRSGDPTKYTHADISLNVWDTANQVKLIDYLKQASIQSEADIGFIDGVTDEYKKIAIQSEYAPYGGDLFLSTKLLRNWLPEMPWAVVFGPAYIRLFGKDNVLNTPAYKIEEIGEELIFVQLTPHMEDIYKHFEMVLNARATAKNHLGEECFYNQELAYNFNAEVEKNGKVFRVPEFELAAN